MCVFTDARPKNIISLGHTNVTCEEADVHRGLPPALKVKKKQMTVAGCLCVVKTKIKKQTANICPPRAMIQIKQTKMPILQFRILI